MGKCCDAFVSAYCIIFFSSQIMPAIGPKCSDLVSLAYFPEDSHCYAPKVSDFCSISHAHIETREK